MLKVALTGGIGCGKSTVCDLFSKKNIPIIDTDIIARELVEPGQPALLKIINYFGSDILFNDSSLNRKALAKKIFNNNKKKLHLESILHPKIKKRVQEKISQLNSSYVIIAIPLLIETNQQSHYDRVLVIDCDEQQQIERTLNRDKRDFNEIKSIINSQASRVQRTAIADDIIKNTGDLISLKNNVDQLHIKYIKMSSSSI